MKGIAAVLLDVEGVLVVSGETVPGASEAIRWLRDRAIRFLLVTNTTTASRRTLAARLGEAGIEVEPGDMMTASAATAAYLRTHHPGARCFLIVKGDAAEDFEGIDLVDDRADVVVVAGAEEALTYEVMNRAFRMLRGGAVLVAMHRNTWWMTADGPRLDAGPFVTALEEASGTRAVVVGKPSPEIFRGSVSILGVEPRRAAMVGDDVETDLLPAQSLGLTGILVRTGKSLSGTPDTAAVTPDHVIGSVADLPALLSEL